MMGLVNPSFFLSNLQIIFKIIRFDFLSRFCYDIYIDNYDHKNL